MGSVEPTTTARSIDGDLKLKIRNLVEAHDKGRACIPPIHNQFYPGMLVLGKLPEAGCYLTAAVFGENDCQPLHEVGMLAALDNKFFFLHHYYVPETYGDAGEQRTLFSAIIHHYDDLGWTDEQVTEWLLSL